MTFKDFIKTKVDDLKVLREKKREILNELNAVKDKIGVLDNERQQLLKSLPNNKDQQNPQKLKQTIDEMLRRYETTTMKSPQEEKKFLADIKKMKESLPSAERLVELKPLIDALYDKKKLINEKLNTLKPGIETKEAEIESVRKELDEAKDKREDIKQQLDKFDADITKLKEDLQGHYTKKDELREEFFKARWEFEIENDLVRHNEWILREKERIKERDNAKQARIEARKQQLADRPNPFQKELDTCERLIAYCQLLKKKVGLGPQTEEVVKEEQKQIINDLAKEEVQKKVKDGKIEIVKTKKEREEEALIQIGGRKKGGKKPKVKQIAEDNYDDVFSNIDISLLNLFGFLKVSPPLDKTQLDSKITELESKQKYFAEEGDKRLKDEEDKVLSGNVEDEEEPEERNPEENQRRGGRGGFRGGRGGRGGFRGGRGGAARRRDDDEDEAYKSSGDEY